MQNRNVFFQDWGRLDYEVAWKRQEELFDAIVRLKGENRTNDTTHPTANYLVFVEHPHVYTLGKSGKPAHLLLDEQRLKEKEASFYKINRGGDITYHGPGQLVGYPILDLDNFFTDIHRYLRFLEEAVILTLADYGVIAGRFPGFTGVWIDAEKASARKICAMGVRSSRWVTMHGFAFNVNSDLNYFKHIVPCGIDDKAVTSLEAELGAPQDMEAVKERLKHHLMQLFDMVLVSSAPASADLLGRD